MPGGFRTGSYVEKGGATLVTPGAGAPPSGPFSGGPFTAGSVIFAAGGFVLTENNPNFFWDALNLRLGIGTNTPTSVLHILRATEARVLVNSPTADAHVDCVVDAGGTNDAAFQLIASGVPGMDWSILLDNDDSDRLKIFGGFPASAVRMTFSELGSVIIGPAALTTTATDGFLYITTSPGTPTGVPTAFAGRQPIHIDTTNNILYFYSTGAWRSASSGGTVPSTRTLFGTSPIRIDGGASGDLSADRTISVLTFGAAQAGVVPMSGGGVVNFLRADGTWAVPAGAVPAGTGGVVYATGGVLLSEPTVFFWDDANDRLGIGTNAPSVDFEVRKAHVGVSATVLAFNTDNTNAGSSAQIWAQVGGGAAGDPMFRLTISGGEDFLGYLDNSDSDIFKLSPSAGVALSIDTLRNVGINSAALATNATDGFLFITTSNGTPTGVPTAFSGRAPIHVDTANNLLYFYSTGAWRTAAGGTGTVNSVTDGTTTVANPPEIEFDPLFFDVTNAAGDAAVTFIGATGSDVTDGTTTVTAPPEIQFDPAYFDVTNNAGDAAVTLIAAPGGGSIWPVQNPPTVANWTWVNQGGATASDNPLGSISLYGPNAGGATQLRILVRTLADPDNFDIKMGFIFSPEALSQSTACVILRENATGKMANALIQYNVGTQVVAVYAMTSATVYGGNIYNPADDLFVQKSPCFFRWTRAAAGDYFFYYSNDGVNWHEGVSFGAASAFTTEADEFGFAMDCFSGGDGYFTLFYLDVS